MWRQLPRDTGRPAPIGQHTHTVHQRTHTPRTGTEGVGSQVCSHMLPGDQLHRGPHHTGRSTGIRNASHCHTQHHVPIQYRERRCGNHSALLRLRGMGESHTPPLDRRRGSHPHGTERPPAGRTPLQPRHLHRRSGRSNQERMPQGRKS